MTQIFIDAFFNTLTILIVLAGMICAVACVGVAAWVVFWVGNALLAQWIEREPSKLGVEGSNPSERATSVIPSENRGSGT